MDQPPSILTNLAFHESRAWREAVTTICRNGETPDGLGAWRQAWRLLRLRRRFAVVVTMAPRPALAYGLLCALLGLESKQVLVEVFLDAPRPDSLAWRLKTALFRRIARRARGILTNSSAEVGFMARRFGIPEHRLRFVPMYTTITEPALAADNDGTVVSIGRTLRDIDTLLRAAPDFGAPLVLVVGRHDPLPEPLPANVQVLRDIPIAAGHDLLRRAAVVVVPLLPAERSTGQVVLFEAMAMGKPVVATRATGTADYIRHGENGLLVEPGDAPGMAAAVSRLLGDRDFARRLGATALQDCLGPLGVEPYARRLLAAIRELAPPLP